MQIPTQDRLKELFVYEQSTGLLIRRVTTSSRAQVGDIAGRIHRKGYRHLRIDGHEYQAHRIVWLYVYGEWPSGQIDHINGIKSDNRIENLRNVSGQENQHNRRTTQKNNTSGSTGVRLEDGRWSASIKVAGKNMRIGRFDTFDQAVEARSSAKRQLHPSAPV